MVYLPLHIVAQDEGSAPPIIFIYDASGSMWGQINGATKMSIASSVLKKSIARLDENQRIGLVAYGHRMEGDCRDVEFIIPLDNKNRNLINSSLEKLKPLGRTPLAFSATRVVEVLRKSGEAATVILITDGIESCDGDICTVVKAAKEDGIALKLHIIGFGLKDSETAQLRCAAEAGDGQYYDASNADQLGNVLEEATNQPVIDPPKNVFVSSWKKGNLIDSYVKAYPKGSTSYKTSARTYQDTGSMHLAPGIYRFEFTPLEGSNVAPVSIEHVLVPENGTIHRSVSFDAGTLSVLITNNNEGWDASVNLFDPVTKKNIAGGRTYGREKKYEVNPGTYNIEVTPMRIKGETVKFSAGQIVVTSNTESTFRHDFKSGIAKIGAVKNGQLVDVVVQITETKTNKRVSGGRTYVRPTTNPAEYILLPGTYQVTLKGLKELQGIDKTFSMTIQPGKIVERITQF